VKKHHDGGLECELFLCDISLLFLSQRLKRAAFILGNRGERNEKNKIKKSVPG
jgi:hypothetical protein